VIRNRRLVVLGGAVVLVLAFTWVRLTFPDDYLALQAATGDRLFEMLRGREDLGTTLTRDDVYAATYGLLGALVLVAALGGRPRRLLEWTAVVLIPLAAVADVGENEFVRALHGKPSAESFGWLDEGLHTVWALKWTALAVALGAGVWSGVSSRRRA
jgi:hypothetical protein